MTKLALVISIQTLAITQAIAQTTPIKNAADSLVVTLPAGKQYVASPGKMFWWGRHYRREWATEVRFPVLNLDTAKGGLTPQKVGGGHQTKTLRLIAGDGKEYVLRTIDKSLDVLIPDEFKGTFINDIVNDQISTAHPYGPVAIAKLADYLHIMHTNPVILYVPDQDRLGEFNPIFANKLCLLEERPSGKGWDHTALSENADDIDNSEKLFEKVYKSNKNQVDQKTFLKIRLFDMLINDWDRHEDQWVWCAHEDSSGTRYEAFGRDRDQAFSKTDGVSLWMISRPWVLPAIQGMHSRVKNIIGQNLSARNLDRQFLNQLTKEDWEQMISTVQQGLPDSAIRAGVNTMPAEVNAISGNFLITRLKQRRDNLPGYGMKYYRHLSKHVTIAGSEKNETFVFSKIDYRHVAVTGINTKNDTFYYRVFDHAATKQINVYGLEGDDRFVFTGDGKNKFLIRTIGGKGVDSFITEGSGGGRRVRVYDSKDNYFSNHRFAVNHSSDSLFQYKRNSVKNDWYVPLIIPGYNPDDQVILGLGLLYKRQQWGKTPFGWQQSFVVNYAFGTGALGFAYKGLFKQTFGKWDLNLAAAYRGPRYILNYYGLGNNTELVMDEKSFYRTKARNWYGSPGVSRDWANSSLRFGLQFETMQVVPTEGKFVSGPDPELDSAVFTTKYFGGVNGSWQYSSRNSIKFPTKGIGLETGFSYYNNLQQTEKRLLKLTGAVSLYCTFFNRLTFAHRSGAATNLGDYEFYQANTLGNSENLRGYWRTRFAGRSSVYQNTELRYNLANLRGYVFRGKIGLIGFFDDGRVWIKGENSNTIHTGYGGGLYYLPYNMMSFTAYYATSKEVSYVTLRAGFFF
ncbi:hypothetical protein A4D02_29225 [Niastella koreensis]|uniref:Metallophosphoesterase n=2 Tax=Niastella koreensis TaxID=354356 RepID=G8TR96_NIAKG|nr:metallophosphoesterase [Niastella koreensis]AEW00018.1 metallophosphoesterase [Niastella koreensis GR20-10]OQP49671.1 hypothetical protein A4D02_29225 [Niastella koreensis]